MIGFVSFNELHLKQGYVHWEKSNGLPCQYIVKTIIADGDNNTRLAMSY